MYIRNADRQRIMQQRDESYRKFLIEESKKEDSKWDSFSENEEEKKDEEEEVVAEEKPTKKNDRKRKAEEVEEAQEEEEEEAADLEEEESQEPVKVEIKKEIVPKFKAKTAKTVEVPKKKLKKKKGQPKSGENLQDSTESLTDNLSIDPSKSICLGCREVGHRLKNCPKFRMSACIKCGGTDHKYQACPTGGDFKFATCFVCKEVVSWNLFY